MDRLRQRYAEPAPESLEFAELASEEPAEDRQEDLELMHKELAAMPLLEREVLVLFYLSELSLSQLAEVLAIPVGTAKSRLFRARQMLRRQLTDKGVQP